ncbi:hypothetical protein VQ643_09460 [Pseudomonas sp. F1_0610]|uniref:hypothetical protein n=1 Tax=Pseudomonas sp. F1_0610 TaxID=3114284 RepID=UPI0039C0491B
MAIEIDDVKLLKSQRLTDEEDGGGRATGEAIIDNEMKNLFHDISRVDRTEGRTSLRKVFAGVVAQNSEPYLGAHTIISASPKDPLVNALLFNTNSQTDERKDAAMLIEGYVMPSIIADFDLLGDQYPGQRQITALQFEERRVPEIGDVFQLVTKTYDQFVRVSAVEHEIRTFYYIDEAGKIQEFQRRYLAISISDTLRNKMPGGQAHPLGTTERNLDGEAKATVRATAVADSARYFGISKLASAVTQGAMNLTVDSIFAQLIPSTIKEHALTDQPGGARKRYSLACANKKRTLELSFVSTSAGQSRSYLGTGALRGSVVLTINGEVLRDNSQGELKAQTDTSNFERVLIDYEMGMITVFRASAFTGRASVEYIVGTLLAGQTVTGEEAIKLGNRGYAYTFNLSEAKPRPGTFELSFRALGRWYHLQDTGSGELSGAGTGSVNFQTGAVSVTLEALPDVNTSLIYSFVMQNETNFHIHETEVNATQIKVVHELKQQGINPVGVVVKSSHSGQVLTMTSDSRGQFNAAHAKGSINGAAGILTLYFEQTLDPGTAIDVEYESGSTIDFPLSMSADATGMSSGTIQGAPLKPGSVWLRWDCKRKAVVPQFETERGFGKGSASVTEHQTESLEKHEARDDGAGNWVGVDGSINYQTGAFSVRTENMYDYKSYHVYWRHESWRLGEINTPQKEVFAGTMLVRAQDAAVGFDDEKEVISTAAITIDLIKAGGANLLPNSLLLQWGGDTYTDRDGVLYKNIDSRTNAGSVVGTVDYAKRTAKFQTWPENAPNKMQLLAALTSDTGFSTSQVYFRTPGTPVRPASIQITALRSDTGEIITATSDLNGKIDKGVIKGTVDYQAGIVRVRFTSDEKDETGKSDIQVISTLIRYNAVLQSSTPVSANRIGLDPVRLPADGRVPIYRDGDMLVIHHTAELIVASPKAGDTIQLPRAEQAAIYVQDANGNYLNKQQFSVDLEAGTLKWANPINLVTQDNEPAILPLTVFDRIEHMTIVTEAQITGEISISSPMPWDMPANETKVSSALMHGDLQARLYRWFTQKTWNMGKPNWTDFPEGDKTTAQYNQLNYPPIVTNMGSIAGKWALVFTSSTVFNVIEEKLGVVGQGSVNADCAPINPATNTPYFLIKKEGWGDGWSPANAVRFNTDACLGDMWVIRTVQPGKGTVKEDSFKIQVRGDAE